MSRQRDLERALEAEGWTLGLPGRNGHIKATHPEASGPLFLASSVGKGRGDRNALAQARRLLRQGRAGRTDR